MVSASDHLSRDYHLHGLPLVLKSLHGIEKLLGFLLSIRSDERGMSSFGESSTLRHLSAESESNLSKSITRQISKNGPDKVKLISILQHLILLKCQVPVFGCNLYSLLKRCMRRPMDWNGVQTSTS